MSAFNLSAPIPWRKEGRKIFYPPLYRWGTEGWGASVTSHRLPWFLAPDGNADFCLKHRVRMFVWVVHCSFHLKRWGPHGASFTSLLIFSHIAGWGQLSSRPKSCLWMSSVWAADLEKNVLVVPLIVTQSRKDLRYWIWSLCWGTWAAPHPGGEPLRARVHVRICGRGAGATCCCGHSTGIKWITNHQKSCSQVKQPSACLWRWLLAGYYFLF